MDLARGGPPVRGMVEGRTMVIENIIIRPSVVAWSSVGVGVGRDPGMVALSAVLEVISMVLIVAGCINHVEVATTVPIVAGCSSVVEVVTTVFTTLGCISRVEVVMTVLIVAGCSSRLEVNMGMIRNLG